MTLRTPAHLFVAVVIALVSTGASAAPGECEVKVYVTDPDPAGLNVREAPSAKAKVVGLLPGVNPDARDKEAEKVAAVMLTVDKARGGWLHFTAVEVATGLPPAPGEDAVAPPRAGWVFAKLTAVDVQPERFGPKVTDVRWPALKRRASTEAKAVRALSEKYGRGAVLGCEGRWVKVRLAEAGKRPALEGWLAPGEFCGNPLTTCP